MKLLDKFLIKRCSTEVQIMLKRMEERPEDFDYGTTWRKLVEVADNEGSPYTKAERRMIRKYWKGCEYARKRNELLGRIMAETINPSKLEGMEEYEDRLRRQYTTNLARSISNAKQLQGGITNISGPPTTGYTDPRAVFGTTIYTGNGAQNSIQHGLHP